ncbi:hypothetical protein [Halomonas sp. E14]|uniref:hypothetical protein n=1 Tax=Halomonas sp. E14 TaxID=3397245 RepID=UPI00403EC7E7
MYFLERALKKLSKKVKSKKTDKKKYLPPDIVEGPLEALVLRQAGKSVAFRCRMEYCIDESGLGFSPVGWHPFVAVLAEYETNNKLVYKDSILEKFYKKWQPNNAGEALIGMDPPPKKMAELPPYALFLSPWKPVTLDELKARIDQWTSEDNLEHGHPELDWKKNGLKFFGPVNDDLGEFEFQRLIDIYEVLRKRGYDRDCGDIGVVLLRHRNEYRFLVAGGGRHRIAALAALGYKEFPAQYIVPQFVVDSRDAEHWPQVRAGMWSAKEATAYMDYLFDFDSGSWFDKFISS